MLGIKWVTPTVSWGTNASMASLVSIHEYDCCIYFDGLISVIVVCTMYIVCMVSASYTYGNYQY